MDDTAIISFVSLVIFYLIYKFISPFASEQLISGYQDLTIKQTIDFNVRNVSTVHSIVVCSCALYLLFFDEIVRKDVIWGGSYGVNVNCGIMIGYMLSDILFMIINYEHSLDFVFFLHHLTTMTGCLLISGYAVLPFYFVLRVLAELSTPFVNIRWQLDALKYHRSSRFFIFNGLILLFMFTIARIFMMPIFYYCLYPIYNTEEWQTLGNLYHIPTVCVILDIFNIFWYIKLCRGAYKLIRSLFMRDANRNIMNVKVD